MESDRIARNTAYLTVASIFQKILSFVYFALLATALHSDLGKYTFALNVSSLFIIFMDFGLGQLLTREGAKDEANIQKHITELWSVKVVLIGFAAVACIGYAFLSDAIFTNVTSLDRNLIIIATAIIIIDTISFTILSIFRAVRTLIWEAIGIIFYQTALVGAGLTAIYLGLNVEAFLFTLLGGSCVQLIYLFIVLQKKTPYRLHVAFPVVGMKRVLIMAGPFAIAGVIYRLTGSLDSMMLKIIDGDFASSVYAIAFKLTFALTVLPGAFATSYYPAMSSYVKKGSTKVAETFEHAISYMALLSAPIAVGVFILGGTIIHIVWHDYWIAAALPLSILITALPFVFFNYPVGNLLNAAGKQHINTINMAISLLVNIALNAWLIPRYSYNGAAVSSLVSSVLLVALGAPWAYKIAKFSWKRITIRVSQVLAAALIMAVVLYKIQYSFPLLALIPISAVIYLIALFITRAVTVAEVRSIVAQIRQRIHHA